MRGIHKPFDKGLYDEFDGPAKDAMKVHLELSGHEVTVPPEDFMVDLSSIYLGATMYHEVEVSRPWKDGEHPFPSGSIPGRKLRLKHRHQNEILFFWMLRLDLRRALVFSSAHLSDEWLVEVPNRYTPEGGEYFYRIPKSLGKEFDMLCR